MTTWELWQGTSGDRRPVTVHAADDVDVPPRLQAVVVVQEPDRLDSNQATFILYAVPDVGPVLAWVGVPGAGPRDGHYVHQASGRTWPWGNLRHAVRFAVDHHEARLGGVTN